MVRILNWITKKKWVLMNALLVVVLVSMLGIQVVDRSDTIDRSVKIGIGNEKVITLGHIAYAAGSVDYVYDGADDNIQFQAALDALPATGGRIVDVSAVQKNFAATVTRAIPDVIISGSGYGSYFTNDGVTALFTTGGNGWTFEDLRTDAGSVNTGATTGWTMQNVTLGGTYYAYRTSESIVSSSWDIPTGRGATYIVAANDAPAQWKAQADVICDNIADQVEVQSLVNTINATSTSGGTILFSPGIFTFSAAVSLNSVNTTQGITFQGSGQTATSIYVAGGGTNNLFERTDADAAFFTNWKSFKFVGNLATASNSGIYLALGADNQITDNFFINFKDYDVYIGSAWNSQIYNNIFEYAGSYGVVIDLGSDARITNNKFLYNYQGLHLRSSNSLVSGNYFYKNQRGAIVMDNNGATYPLYNVIANNTFQWNGTDAANTYDAILVGGRYNTITGNTFEGHAVTRYAITENGAGYLNNIVGNTAYNHTNASPYYINLYGTDRTKTSYVETFSNIFSANTSYVRDNQAMSTGLGVAFTIDNQPDVPRTLTWAMTHGNVTAFSIYIVGYSAQGILVTEVLTDAIGWSGETAYAFAEISSIKIITRTGTGVGDTIDVGIGSKLGLSNTVYAVADVYKARKNDVVYPAASFTVGTAKSTIDVSTGGAITDNDDFTFWYMSSLNVED